MEAPQAAKTRKMVEALKLIRDSKESLFSLDQSEAGKEETKLAWIALLAKTTSIGWTQPGQSWVNLKRKWNSLNSETRKSIRAKYAKARDDGQLANYTQKEALVIQILNLDINTPGCSTSSNVPEPSSIPCKQNHIETQTEEPLKRKPTTRSQGQGQ